MNRVISSAALIPKTCVRTVSTTASRRPQKPDITKLKRKQMLFQVENDVPVYLKGGFTDYVLYYATLALTLGGLALSSQALYELAKKNKS